MKDIILYISLSLHFNGYFSRWTSVSRYQNVSMLDLIEAKDDGDGGDNWSYKTCKAAVKSPPTKHKQQKGYINATSKSECFSCLGLHSLTCSNYRKNGPLNRN